MKWGAESQHAFLTKRVFFAVARIILRNLNFFWRIAVPAVLDNRRPAMEMRYPADGAGRSGHGLARDAPATLRLPESRLGKANGAKIRIAFHKISR